MSQETPPFPSPHVESVPFVAPAGRRVALSVEGLSKRYEDQAAVQDLSFEVAEGEILGLVGANGAGKTTTLRSIAGILPLQAGRVLIRGHDLVAHELSAKRELAWIPDDPQPFDNLTVDEHLRFTAALYGEKEWQSRAEDLLKTFELVEKRGALGGELSRGMRQKLAIACGLVHDPAALILDEPLTGLDPVGIRRMKATIAERARRGAAVILSSHLLHLVEELCTRLLVIQRGRAVAYGTFEEIVTERPELVGLDLEEVFLALTEPTDAGSTDAGVR